MKILERWLAAVQRHKVWGWVLLMIYVPSVIFPHDVVQYYVNEIASRYTHKRLYQGAAIGGEVIGVIVTLAFMWCLRKRPERLIIGMSWLVTLGLIIACWWA